MQDCLRPRQREIVLAPEAALIIVLSEQWVMLCRGYAERVKQSTSLNITHAHTHVLAYWAGAPCCLSCTRPVQVVQVKINASCRMCAQERVCDCDGFLCVDSCSLC